MPLSKIDIDAITTLPEAKNVIELLLEMYGKQEERISRLEAEIVQLKGQPKKPHFSGNKQSASVTKFLKEKSQWHKSSKGKLSIAHEEKLTEIDHCECGSREFRTLRTTAKVVQGIVFKRNNIAYHGRQKQCINCGKKYKSILPKELQGVSFDLKLKSLLSYLKFSCRMTYPLIHRMLTGLGIKISYGEINEI